jgi:hypothetical protein
MSARATPPTGTGPSSPRRGNVPEAVGEGLGTPVRIVAVSAQLIGDAPGGTTGAINSQPARLAAEIARKIENATPPTKRVIADIRRQLVHHKAQPAPECVVESFYRCLLTDHFQQRSHIELDDLPSFINSSHWAASLVCSASPRHSHYFIPGVNWRAAWQRMRKQYPNRVDMSVPVPHGGKSLRRADLYVVAQGQIVSIEFKYVGPNGVRNPKAVAKQMELYVKHHAATLLVIYSSTKKRSEVRGLARLGELLDRLGSAVTLVVPHGPAIPPA